MTDWLESVAEFASRNFFAGFFWGCGFVAAIAVIAQIGAAVKP